MRILRKLTTKPIWWLETRRRYPIRERVFGFPPKPVEPQGKSACTVVICATPATLNDAAWAAYSILAEVRRPLALTFVCRDFPEQRKYQLQCLFPGCRMVLDRELEASCTKGELINVRKLAQYHPMGSKLLGVLKTQEESDIIFSDADMLAFRELSEVESAMDAGNGGLHIQDVLLPGEPETAAIARTLGLKAHPRFSCGFMYIPKLSLDLQLANCLLDTERKIESWFPDTRVLSYLMAKAGASALPDSRYIQNTARQFWHEPDVDYERIALRHFVGPVRHRMYSAGMPLLLKRRTPFR